MKQLHSMKQPAVSKQQKKKRQKQQKTKKLKAGHTGNIIKARGVDRHVGGGCGATGEYGEVRLLCMFFCDTLHLHLAFGRVAQLAACPH